MINKDLLSAQQIFKTISDETRFEIVFMLFKNKKMSCSEISSYFPHLTQPTLSHHFKILHSAGLLSVEKIGTSHEYSLDRDLLQRSGIDLSKIGR